MTGGQLMRENLFSNSDQVMSDAVQYYNENAESFIENTLKLDMEEFYSKFLTHIPRGGFIFDVGCGSGRDSLAFLKRGYRVKAMDASSVMADYTAELLGQPVLCANILDIDYQNCFDGVWASASLLHIPNEKMDRAFKNLYRSLKPEGVCYMSFKKGDFDTCVDGRYFNNFTRGSLTKLVSKYPQLSIIEIWESRDIRKGREQEIWMNILVQK